MATYSLKGKRILITQNALRILAGSEIATLELATFFQSSGAEVVVFSWYTAPPMKDEFEKRKIYVTTDNYDKVFERNFDIVWVHHQVIPLKIIESLGSPKKHTPNFFFYHMSAIDHIKIEQPYIHDLEKKIAKQSIFVSQECLDFNTKKYGRIFNHPIVMPNLSPIPFISDNPTIKHNKPQTILTVSNHPPKELIKAKKELRTSGIVTESAGENTKSYKLITPDKLKSYDVVVANGKTVQYCLTLGVPIYIYDQFGGCGYLNSNNFKKALYHNFSGRGFEKKTPEKIASEITSRFLIAQKFQYNNLKQFQNCFSLSNNIVNIFRKSTKYACPTKNLTPNYIQYVINAETIAMEKIVAENELTQTVSHLTSIKEQLEQTKRQKEELNQRISKLEKKNLASQSKIFNLENLIVQTQNSRAVKLSKSIRRFLHYTKSTPQNPTTPEITAVLCLYNEALNIDGCLNHLEPYVDKIIIFDDGSTDETISIAKTHSKVVRIIRNKKKKEWLERRNRATVINEAYKQSKRHNSWVLCIDADERFELPFLQSLRTIATQYYNHPVVINVYFRELWDSIHQYRSDGIWGEKRKSVFFPLASQMTFNYTNEHHIPWNYQELTNKEILTNYNLYHLKMIKPIDRQKRADLYNKLDPNKEMQSIGYDYLTDITNLNLSNVPDDHPYNYNTVPDYYK